MRLHSIEIKARSYNNDRFRTILEDRHADFRGTDHQIDTYLKTSRGRLKIREGRVENNRLVYYERADETGPKHSDVLVFEYDTGTQLKDMLVAALGILIVVDKQREIYYINNVKFHLDQLRGLGQFVEIEAIGRAGETGLEPLRKQCNFYRGLLGIRDEDLIDVSYSDLLLRMCKD